MKRVCLLGILILILGCNYIPCSSSSDLTNVKELSNPSFINGIYKPDEFTKADFKEYSDSDSTFLVIKDDMQLELHNFPKSTISYGEKYNNPTFTGSGTWTIGFKSGTTTLDTYIISEEPVIIQSPIFRLFKKQEKYYILIDFGDPDNCTSVRLKQQ